MYTQNPYGDDLQRHTFQEACKLAASGEEFSHLIQLMTPDMAMRLRCYVRDLPEPIRLKTIYGRAVSKDLPPPKRTKR